MADFSLEAQPRTITGKKVSQLRNAGLVPATIYGPKIEPVNIQVPYRALEVMLMNAGGTNLVDIKVDGKKLTVLTRDVQRHVLKRTIMHVDFYVVDQTMKIRTSVPVQFVGESPIVAQRRGLLITGANSVNIETLPSNLLHAIEVDLSKLDTLGSSITVGDLDLGEEVTILDDPEEMLAKVLQTSAARAEEDLEAAEELTSSSEPEVITKGKQDEDEF